MHRFQPDDVRNCQRNRKRLSYTMQCSYSISFSLAPISIFRWRFTILNTNILVCCYVSKKLRAEKKNQNIFFVFFIRNEWVPLFSCMGRSQCSFAGSFVQLWMRFCVQHRHKAWTMAKQKTIKHLISMNYIENSIWVVLACSVGTRANVLYT